MLVTAVKRSCRYCQVDVVAPHQRAIHPVYSKPFNMADVCDDACWGAGASVQLERSNVMAAVVSEVSNSIEIRIVACCAVTESRHQAARMWHVNVYLRHRSAMRIHEVRLWTWGEWRNELSINDLNQRNFFGGLTIYCDKEKSHVLAARHDR